MATNSSQQNSSQDEYHLVAGQQQLPENTPASNSAAVEGVELQSVDIQPRASGIEKPSRSVQLTLLKNIFSGDLDSVSKFLNNYNFPLSAQFLNHGSVLHAATAAGQLKIVELLLSIMSEEELEVTDSNDNTPMNLAAMHGHTEIAECLNKRNEKLITTTNSSTGYLPVLTACIACQKDTTSYLYSVTPNEFLLRENKIHGSALLVNCVWYKQFDVAFDLMRQCPALAFGKDDLGHIPIINLSSEPSFYLSGSGLAF